MKTTLEQLKQFNEQYDRDEYLYCVHLYDFKKWNDGAYHHNGGSDDCFCLTNDFEHAKQMYKEACSHAHLGRDYYLVTLDETIISDSDCYYETVDTYEYSNLPDGYKICW